MPALYRPTYETELYLNDPGAPTLIALLKDGELVWSPAFTSSGGGVDNDTVLAIQDRVTTLEARPIGIPEWETGNTSKVVWISTPMIDWMQTVSVGTLADRNISPLLDASAGLWLFDWQYNGSVIHEVGGPLAQHYIADDTHGTVKIISDGINRRYFKVATGASLEQKRANPLVNGLAGHREIFI